MAGINKVILVGNLGRDPEVRVLESGTKVAQFSIATTESYKDRDGNWQDQTEWHNLVLWRYLAERAEQNLRKGMQIYVEGKLKTRSWTDQNQQTRYTTDIVVDKFIMLGRKGEGGSMPPIPTEDEYQGNAPKQEQNQNATESAPDNVNPNPAQEVDDDLPF